MNKRGLGKGLGALIPTNTVSFDPEKDSIIDIQIDQITTNTYQPRRNFDEEKLKELALSIKEHGVLQPIIVRPNDSGYEIVVGERRFRACKLNNFEKIPAVVKTLTDQEMSEIALIENIQRHDLNPIEEAIAYKKLIEEFGLTQEEVAKKIGKSRPFIANHIRVLHLPDIILDYIIQGALTVGHARPLLTLETDDLKIQIAKQIIEKNISVRGVEEFIKNNIKKTTPKKKTQVNNKNNPLLNDIQDNLRSKFGTKVTIKDTGKKGRIEIDYYSEEDLQRIIDLIFVNKEF